MSIILDIVHLTYHDPDIDSAGRDRPVLGSIQDRQGQSYVCVEFLEGGKDTLIFERSWAEQYVEGRVWIALKLERTAIDPGDAPGAIWGVVRYECEVGQRQLLSPGVVQNRKFVDGEGSPSGQQHGVLVGNIEPMELVKRELPSLKRFYLVEDNVDDVVCKSVGFLSLHGAGKAGLILSEVKPGVITNGPALALNEQAVRVIECHPEVMDRISKNSGDVLGHLTPESTGSLPAVTVFLGPASAHVCVNVAPENRLKLTDVMFGPVQFKVGSKEIERHD